MEKLIKISAAGNIEPSLFEILKKKGYSIEIIDKVWIAKKPNLEFRGENIVELAGIVLMYEAKESNWRVSDSVIDDYLDFLQSNEK